MGSKAPPLPRSCTGPRARTISEAHTNVCGKLCVCLGPESGQTRRAPRHGTTGPMNANTRTQRPRLCRTLFGHAGPSNTCRWRSFSAVTNRRRLGLGHRPPPGGLLKQSPLLRLSCPPPPPPPQRVACPCLHCSRARVVVSGDTPPTPTHLRVPWRRLADGGRRIVSQCIVVRHIDSGGCRPPSASGKATACPSDTTRRGRAVFALALFRQRHRRRPICLVASSRPAACRLPSAFVVSSIPQTRFCKLSD